MPVKSFNPVTPSRRYMTVSSFSEITKTKPEKRLVKTKKRSGGRNSNGRVTARGIGGGHKQKVRNVDFKRNKHGIAAEVIAIEYDPCRSARLALLKYEDGEKRYMIAVEGQVVGNKVMSGPKAPVENGNFLPLANIPPGSEIHNLEMTPGRGGQLVRSAGVAASLMAVAEGYAQVKLPSGEIRRINEKCYATIGTVGNADHEKIIVGKAGRTRHKGKRPITRAVAKNPVDHPMGGGEGRTSGGGHPMSPWGVLAKGFKTRPKDKPSNKWILVRRDGRPMKKR
ncbi:MAG: 50S ribosomal protein L2 [Limisphaerales bacterium]